MPLSIDMQIQVLADSISSAQLHFDVWRALEIARSDPENVRVMNEHLEFLYSTVPANFESCVVSCYQFLETKDDRVSFPSLIKSLLESERIAIREDTGLKELEDRMKPTWVRISTLRNNHIGHLSRNSTPAEVYARAGLNDVMMKAYIDDAKELHRGITFKRSRTTDAFNIRGQDSVERLLANLRRSL